jgi:two-component system, OmpR family, alkaline phosphatase synthesis response regulator PhoP
VAEGLKRILVCDDDQDALYMVTFVLTGIGWEVYTSLDSNNIVEKTLECSPAVILMDIHFPEQDGIIASQILKEHPDTKHIPIVMFSSNTDIVHLSQMAGASFYITKPFEIKKLENTVAEAYQEYLSNTG